MVNKMTLKELASYAVIGKVPTNFDSSIETVNKAFSGELSKLADSVNTFMANKHVIFEILIEAADSVVPKRVSDAMAPFADVRTIDHNQRLLFKRSRQLGRSRARKFLTQVGASGVYETFRLDSDTFEVRTRALGGGISIDFDRLRAGDDSLADLMSILTEGFVDAAFGEVQKALRNAVSANVPDANRVIENAFDGEEMFKLISTVRAYAPSAVILAPPEFIGAMGADAIVPVASNGAAGGIYHQDDIDAIHRTGYINLFRGTPVVQMPQSFVDESNDKTWIDPQLAYVLPVGTGPNGRVVKVVFEGGMEMWDFVNRDRSIEIMASKKIGAAIDSLHNWGIYQNSGIAQTFYDPYPNV